LLHNLPVPLLLQHPAWSAGQVAAAGEILDHEGCSVAPSSGSGDETERFEALGNWQVSVLMEQRRVLIN